MSGTAAQLAGRLAREAEAVCRHYLSKGHRAGRYWQVGDVFNSPGRSLYVRLTGPESGPGAAGRWTDAATGEYGDLLDLIARNGGFETLREAIEEAHRFLGSPSPQSFVQPRAPVSRNAVEAARRLFAASLPPAGTLAERYLRGRGITARLESGPLRFHPTCFYRPNKTGPAEAGPALIAAVTDASGLVRGVQRTWLAADGRGKAPLATPRRAMGALRGHGVRFGRAETVLAAGEGIETMLSLRSALPGLHCIAALSAGHLAALRLPNGLQRLYITSDNDAAGRWASKHLAVRAAEAGITVWHLTPIGGDFNDDLQAFGPKALQAQLLSQMALADTNCEIFG